MDETILHQMRHLLQQRELAIDLLGEIVATFAVIDNRASLSQNDAGKSLLAIADDWMRRITGRPVGRIIGSDGTVSQIAGYRLED